MKLMALTTALALGAAAAGAQSATPFIPPTRAERAEALKLLRRTPLIDGHSDLAWRLIKATNGWASVDLSVQGAQTDRPLVTDLPRLRAGGLGAQFWAVYVPPESEPLAGVKMLFEQINAIRGMTERYPGTFAFAQSAADIERIHRQGKIASLIGLEGGHALAQSLDLLRAAHRLGARYLTLTHTRSTEWADSANDRPRNHGLSSFGVEVIREMNRLGMMADLSHASDETAWHVLQVSRAPVILSHSPVRAFCSNPRCVPDDLMKAVADKGGIVMLTFLPIYLTEEAAQYDVRRKEEDARLKAAYADAPEAAAAGMAAWRKAHPAPVLTVHDVVRHIEHARQVAGVDHIGIGSDFEGYTGPVLGLEDVACYPNLLVELRRRGWSKADLGKLAGKNFLKTMRAVEQAARP